jgi:hypothetical protein
MDAELMAAADRSFSNSLNQLMEAAEKANFSKIEGLRSLKEDIESATYQRNLLTHRVWIEVQGKIVMQNFPDYHERKWCSLTSMVNESHRSPHRNGRSKSWKNSRPSSRPLREIGKYISRMKNWPKVLLQCVGKRFPLKAFKALIAI